jgi:hypothetical protein
MFIVCSERHKASRDSWDSACRIIDQRDAWLAWAAQQ